MARAQGSLEYLILIAVVLGIVTVVILIVTNYMGSQQSTYSINNCRNTAAACKVYLSVNPLDTCNSCDSACNASDGKEVSTNAIQCCKWGLLASIYVGANGSECQAQCGNGILEHGEQCDLNQNGICGDGCNSDCTCKCPTCGCYVCFNGACTSTCATGCQLCPDGACRTTCESSGTLSFKETNISSVYGNTVKIVVGNADNQQGNKVYASFSGYSPYVYIFNNVSGGWQVKSISTAAYPPSYASNVYDLAIGNFSYDGKNELITIEDSTNHILYYDSASGTWKLCAQIYYNNGYTPHSLALINNELGINFNGQEQVYVPGGIGCPQSQAPPQYIIGTGGTPLVAGDVDNDHNSQVEFVMPWSNQVTMLKQVSGWTFAPTTIATNLPAGVTKIAIGDADNDLLNNEVVVSMPGVSYPLRMYKNESGNWTETNISDEPSGVTIASLAIGSVAGDGDNEIVVGLSNGAIKMYRDNLLTHTWTETTVANNPGTIAGSIAIGDANNDGKNEIVVGLYNPNFGYAVANATRMYSYTYS